MKTWQFYIILQFLDIRTTHGAPQQYLAAGFFTRRLHPFNFEYCRVNPSHPSHTNFVKSAVAAVKLTQQHKFHTYFLAIHISARYTFLVPKLLYNYLCPSVRPSVCQV